MKKILLLTAFTCAITIIFAQTPFDSFDSTMKKVPVFKSESSPAFMIINTDKTSAIKFILLDVDERTLEYYNQKDSLIASVYLKPGTVKFLSVDPLSNKYPMLTPYQFASNSPISGIDLDGLEYYYAANGNFIAKSRDNNTQVRVVKAEDVATAWQLLRRPGSATTADLNKISTDVGINNAELNTRAFMSTLKQAENHGESALPYNATNHFTKGKVNTFTDKTFEEAPDDYADHPGDKSKTGSSAAGAYQILGWVWNSDDNKKRKEKYDITDFSPQSQDKFILATIKDKRKALELVKSGNLDEAVKKLSKEWTSLPGASQQGLSLDKLKELFKQNVSNELNGNGNIALPKGQTLNSF